MKKKLLYLMNIIIVLFTLLNLFWVVVILYSKFMTNFSVGIIGSMSWVDMFLLLIVISALILYFKIKSNIMIIITVVLLLSRVVLMFFARM
jgi:hypothetical protein